MRDRINTKVKQAMREKDSEQLGTLRLINAAIKDRDIAARAEGNYDGVSDEEILTVMARMIKQRRESAKAYEEGGRLELAEKEISEISIIEQFLPKQLSDEELQTAVKKAISETGAESIRDMGRVMGILKSNYTGQMDFGKAGGTVKEMLG
ncbi:GatB/YqeY domain-containing protein [Neptunicoccus cionae]|uniref:Aspartyl-tRNA amidotransferase subunit B n=1 Tax=Neptunicoccus cionae TaxID=2035344 RepID=A0A916VMW4_9RHOB|nr:aspartyl-tRNA amidotransferase subunit B [Amylibacter cionae]